MSAPAPPSVTQADRDAYDCLMYDDLYDYPPQGALHFARHRTTAEAASAARVAELAGAIRALSQLAIDGGLTHDIMAQIYPGKKTANGQPADEFARRARRVVNEARALLAKHQQGEVA